MRHCHKRDTQCPMVASSSTSREGKEGEADDLPHHIFCQDLFEDNFASLTPLQASHSKTHGKERTEK